MAAAAMPVTSPCSKKYQIEEMRGEDVVSRKRGFTVDTCVSGKTASEETPMFNGMSTGAKVRACACGTGRERAVLCLLRGLPAVQLMLHCAKQRQ